MAGRDGAGAACPYPGLAAFTGEQAGWFYGRDQLTADLLALMDDHVDRCGPVMVVAASGAGKSSLLRAGLLHRIASGGLPAAGSRDWPQVVFTPGAHPMRQAAAALTAVVPGVPDGSGGPPDAGPGDLDGLLRQLLGASAGTGGRVVMVVDQFEELFTLCGGQAERGAFISWLWRAAGHDAPGGPLALVACGLRADVYAQCVTGYPQLRQSLQADQIVVGPMTGQELRQAIRCPAEAAGLEIEPGLADVLLADLRAERDVLKAPGGDLVGDYDAGRLPLLAHALRATWQQRHGSTLTVDGYRATGGIEHAIARTAEEAYNRLDAAGRGGASRIMFLRLVKVGASGGEDARRLVTRSDLTSGSATAGAVLDEFIGCRLLTTARDAIQITHEALLTAWPRLRTWLDEDRAGDLVRQGIEDAAADWERAPRDTSLLYRGARLETAVAWASTRSGGLTRAAQGFLDASRRLARRTTLVWRGTMAILAALTLTASTFAVIASQQRATASRQRDQAISNLIVAEANLVSGTNPSLATQLLLTAYRRQPTQDLAARLMSSENELLGSLVTASDAAVNSVAFNPDRRILATGASDIRLWNVSDPARPRELGRPLTAGIDLVYSVAFSPDGRVLACGDYNGTVRLWNVADPARPREVGPPLVTGSSIVESVTFSPDGRVLASGGENGGPRSYSGAVRLWDVSDPADPREISRSMSTGTSTLVRSVAFSPDGQTIATGDSSGTVRLWNITVPARISELGPPLSVGISHAIAFSADGHTVASGGDGAITLWDTTDPARSRELGRPLAAGAWSVISVAFGPDGRTLASAGNFGEYDGRVGLWDVSDPARPRELGRPLTTGSTGVNSVAFSPDGLTLASGDKDGTIMLWDITAPTRPRQFGELATGGTRVSVAFSPDGQTLASGTDGTIWLWNLNISYAISWICGATDLTRQQWDQYISQLPYNPPCR